MKFDKLPVPTSKHQNLKPKASAMPVITSDIYRIPDRKNVIPRRLNGQRVSS